jgi:hypothetical protein
LICAGATFGGGGGAGFLAGVRRRWASASEAHTSRTIAAMTLTLRMIEV